MGTTLLGAWTADNQTTAIPAFEQWLGRKIRIGMCFLDGQGTWDQLGGAPDWATAQMLPTGKPVVWSMSLLPTGGPRLDVPASGAADAYFTRAFTKLATYPFRNADGTARLFFR